MKKFLSIVALATAICTMAFAQENGNRTADGKIVRGPYVTNSFFDNTFVELQGGFNLMGATHCGTGHNVKALQLGAGAGVNLGKWFNPNFGLRLGWQGVQTAFYPCHYDKHVNPFHYAHADFLVNISNWFSGYKETRIWDFVPYAHAGYVYTKPCDVKTNLFGAGVGLYNKIRLADHWGLSLDLRTIFTSDHIMGDEYAQYISNLDTKTVAGVVSAFIGVNYNFGKTGWVRGEKNDAALVAGAGAAAAGLVLGEYIGAAKKDEGMQNAQKTADKNTVAAEARYNKAVEAYEAAAKKVDVDGNVTPAVYANVDPELAAAYADMANFEDCPDFTTMTKAEKAAWDKSHKDILPDGWKKMTDEQKNQWVKETVYDPAQAALDEKEAAVRELADAKAAMTSAGADCDAAVAKAQYFVDDAAKRIDSNGKVVPACYPNVDPATAQKYADIANTEVCPDFTKMSKKEQRAWNKAHKDILPKDWKKMTAEQKNDWLVDNIFGPAAQAKADDAAAKEELEIAQARKAAFDKKLADMAAKNLDEAVETDGIGYFTINKSVFNEKQLANWKKSIKKYDKAANYTVTGYADKETGSEARNAKLRKERSEYVVKLLKENGFTGEITATPASPKEKYVNFPIWKNRSALISEK